ncbi:MAG: PKD domain-containing protein, partial [Chitinophagaceae bacterium]
MRIRTLAPILILLFFFPCRAFSQACTTLGQTPETAFPVCGTSVFTQNNVPTCGGRPIPGPCNNAGIMDVNPFWYRFTCFTAGTLGFTITPFQNSDDYDWQVFDITGRKPQDVYADASLFVVCNWSGNTGLTGASSAGPGLIQCAGTAFPTFSSMPTLIAGHEYLLMVSNFSASQKGYQLAFTGG